jgi:SAM-dependent methyltransferase
MGIDSHTLEFLIDTRKSGVEFGNTVTLGRQDLLVEYNDIEDFFKRYNIPYTEKIITDFFKKNNQFSEPLIEYLGATNCHSMDFSDFEKATIVHDLNKPIDDPLIQKFDTVIDGGTLEHVFNFPQAIKNCMEMLKTGGHFISITPVNNFMGHGFYQLSPELFFRVLSEENGFKMLKMIFCEVSNDSQWYEVADPVKVAHRVGTVSAYPCYLMLIAEKIAHSNDIFKATPQQSDYANEWANKNNKGDDIGRLWFWNGKTTPASRSTLNMIFSQLKYPLKYFKKILLNKFIYKFRDLDNKSLFTPYVKKG